MSKLDPRVNKYRRGAKNPQQEVYVSRLDDGGLAVLIVEGKRFVQFRTEELPEDEKTKA